jgi:hypothetical protein
MFVLVLGLYDVLPARIAGIEIQAYTLYFIE